MVQEIPIDGDTGETDAQDNAQEQEAEPASSPPPEPASSARVPQEQAPKKRGRPKKIANSVRVPQEHPEPEPPPPPAPKPQRKPKVAKAPPPEAFVEPFSLDAMSSAQLVAELVNRRRASEREMKQNLYRSFVM